MIKIVSYILIIIFLISHSYWQYNLYKQQKKYPDKYFRNHKELLTWLKEESELTDQFFNKIRLSKLISKISIGGYLILFIFMIISSYNS